MLLNKHTPNRGFTKLQNHFTDTVFYQIELTAKYCKLLGQQVFEKYGAGITPEEFSTLDTLICNPNICQRDLAKLILKDRANTGKILDSLERKGFITRKLSIKNNRPVKIAQITEAGLQKAEEVTTKIKPHLTLVRERINNSDLAKVSGLLKELRDVLNETLEIQI